MAGYDLAFANQMVTEYGNALSAVLRSQNYTILGRSLVRADLADIQRGIKFWNSEVVKLTNGHILQTVRVIPDIQ